LGKRRKFACDFLTPGGEKKKSPVPSPTSSAQGEMPNPAASFLNCRGEEGGISGGREEPRICSNLGEKRSTRAYFLLGKGGDVSSLFAPRRKKEGERNDTMGGKKRTFSSSSVAAGKGEEGRRWRSSASLRLQQDKEEWVRPAVRTQKKKGGKRVPQTLGGKEKTQAVSERKKRRTPHLGERTSLINEEGSGLREMHLKKTAGYFGEKKSPPEEKKH